MAKNNNDGTAEARYYGYNPDLVDYEYEADDEVPEWVKSKAGIERMMRRELETFKASQPQRKINLGLDYINQQLKGNK